MRIAFVDLSNLQHNFYNYARYSKAKGHDSFVLLPRSSQLEPEYRPEWSDPSAAGGVDGPWVSRIDAPSAPLRAPLAYLRDDRRLLRVLRSSDVVVCSGQGLLWARRSGRPFVFISFGSDLDQLAETGWSGNPDDYQNLGLIRTLGYAARRSRTRAALARAARAIVAPHQFDHARALGLSELRWMNHVLDFEILKPLSPSERDAERRQLAERFPGEHLVLIASRQAWRRPDLTDYKGTDQALRALASAKRSLPASLRILLVEKGWDLEATRELVRQLGLEREVAWLEPMPRPALARLYGSVDVVLDQFGVGILALVAVEAMACGAAVLTKLPSVPAAPFYREPPSFAHVASEAELASRLVAILGVAGERDRLGALGSDWARRHCHWEVGIAQLLSVVEEARGQS